MTTEERSSRNCRIAELYVSGMLLEQIGLEIGCSAHTAKRVAKSMGLADRREKWTDERRAQAKELYDSGMTLAQVAEQMNSSDGRIREALDATDTSRRPFGSWCERRVWTPERDRKVAEMYKQGLTFARIAEMLHTSARLVRESTMRSGVSSRAKFAFPTGETNISWRGGRKVDKHGYILVRNPEHPSARKGYIREHRLVMEQTLGRYLESGEVVHHINGQKDDNRPENLQLYENNATHLKDDLKGRCPNWTEDGRRRLAESSDRRRSRPGRRRQPAETDVLP